MEASLSIRSGPRGYLPALRALLDWRQDDLARAADVGITTIRRIEAQPGPVMGYVSTVLRIQAAFEEAGVQFTDDESDGIGVRLLNRPKLSAKATGKKR